MDAPTTKRGTLTVWTFVALFLALGALGLGMIFLVGNPKGPSSQLEVPQTTLAPAPGASGAAAGDDADAGDDAAAAGDDESASAEPAGAGQDTGGTSAGRQGGAAGPGGSSGPVVTVPGGAPAPVGVREVLVAQDTTSYSLDVPESVAAQPLTTRIAPADATADGDALTIRVRCAASVDEVLAQVSVSESADTVSVAAAVLVPADGRPCGPGASGRTLTVPLARPLGTRDIFVLPPGTRVPAVRPS